MSGEGKGGAVQAVGTGEGPSGAPPARRVTGIPSDAPRTRRLPAVWYARRVSVEPRPWSLWTLVAAVIGVTMTAIYVALIVAQDDTSVVEALPFATMMGLASGMALAAARVRSTAIARRLLISGALLFTLIGVLAILSIGLALLMAGGAAALGVRRTPRHGEWRRDPRHSPFGQTPPF